MISAAVVMRDEGVRSVQDIYRGTSLMLGAPHCDGPIYADTRPGERPMVQGAVTALGHRYAECRSRAGAAGVIAN